MNFIVPSDEYVQFADQKDGRMPRRLFALHTALLLRSSAAVGQMTVEVLHNGRGGVLRAQVRARSARQVRHPSCLRFSSNGALDDLKLCLETAGVDNVGGDQHTTSDLNFSIPAPQTSECVYTPDCRGSELERG